MTKLHTDEIRSVANPKSGISQTWVEGGAPTLSSLVRLTIIWQNQWRIQDFPEGGAPTLKGGGAPTYYLPHFSQKLHENKEILAERGRARIPGAPLRSATANTPPQKNCMKMKEIEQIGVGVVF